MTKMTAGKALVDALHIEGVETAFGVLGSTLLPVYAELADHPIRLIAPRSEDGAGHMADAYSRVSGLPGVVMSTVGPGAAGVIAAMGEAFSESWPLLHITTQIPTEYLDKDKGVYHDGPNQRQLFETVSCWTHRVTHAAEIPEAIHEAYRQMYTGRPRPAFIEIPADILREECDIRMQDGPVRITPPAPDDADVLAIADALLASERPVIWAGGGCVKADAGGVLQEIAELLEAPILSTNGSKGVVSDFHPLMVGNIATVSDVVKKDVLAAGDMLLAIGTRFSQRATDWWRLKIPPRLAHVDIDPGEFNRNFPADLTAAGDAKLFLVKLLEILRARQNVSPTWGTNTVADIKRRARAQLQAAHPEEFEMLDNIASVLPEDSIVTAQSMMGHWCRFALERPRPRSFLYANTYGSMAFAFHAAIGAKIGAPDRTVVGFCGDGGFMAGCGELATIAQLDLDLPIVIVNNGGFAILRARQVKNYGQAVGTDLYNPDFQMLGQAFGFKTDRVPELDAFPHRLRQAIDAGGRHLIEVPIEFADYRDGAIQ